MEICKISPMDWEVTVYAARIHRNYAECCSSVSPAPDVITRSRPQSPRPPLMLAWGWGGEDDRPLQKI